MEAGFRLETTDPEALQEALLPLVGTFRVRPARDLEFNVKIDASGLKKIGLFTVRSTPLKVDIRPPLPFFGINLPLGSPITILDNTRRHDFLKDLHLVAPDRSMHLETPSDCRVLAVCLDRDTVHAHARRLTQSHMPLESGMQSRLASANPAAHALLRSLARLWSERPCGTAGPGQAMHAAENEDAVIAHFILATAGGGSGPGRTTPHLSAQLMTRAEDYLCARLDKAVSRADLAEVSSVSIRTLSRGFMKRHGMGPMQFLKARRLDAAYRDLLGYGPEGTSVTDVAMRYGFTHLGRFAVDYRRTFRESPSHTLNR